MMKIKLEGTRVFFENYNSQKPVVINIGGARSSKTYSICQVFLTRFLNENNKKFLICRKSLPSLKKSVLITWRELLEKVGPIKDLIIENKQELSFKFKKNLLLFSSIDEKEKIKSTEFNYIFMEEANEFDYEDYRVLKMRLSAPHKEGEVNQIFLALNPVRCWVDEIVIPNENCDVIKSTYKDCIKFLPKDYIKELEALQHIDKEYWIMYGLGEYVNLSNIIYTNYELIEDDVYENLKADEVIYGLDFGFNNPSALVEVKVKDNIFYLKELIYQTNLTNQELIELLKENVLKNKPIYADAEEPSKIEEIYRAGFNILPSAKGKNSVKDGIDFIKRFTLLITKSSVNFIKEIKSYKWKVDKENKILDEPVKFNDHLMDAMRYAIYTHYRDKIGYSFKNKNVENLVYSERITHYDNLY